MHHKNIIEEEKFDLVIGPAGKLFDLQLKDIWRYKDLLLLFVKRDFATQYKQTILGPLWHILQPILTTLMFLVVFGKIAKIPTEGIHPVVFYMSGITIWNYFTACLNNTSNTFVSNAAIFGKVYFPRLVVPLSVILSNIARFGIQFGLLMIAMIYYHFNGHPIHITILWLWIPALLIPMAGIGLGIGTLISALTTKYRDLNVLLGYVVQLLMYLTPIGYPLSYLAHSKYREVLALNPLTPVIEAFRCVLFGTGTFTLNSLLYSIVFMLVTMFCGLLIFNKVEKTFMDTV